MASVTYVLPIRSESIAGDELIRYLQALAARCEVIVVDGSATPVFDDLAARCRGAVRHVAVDPELRTLLNGKVAGVLTGVRLASHERLVIADDDVRYDDAALTAVVEHLDEADVVRPQNYFDPLPWHACLDTARMLINRVTGGDWPGTLAVRRSALVRSGGYDGNVLFENLELVRTVTATGGREVVPRNLFVRRLPPSTQHFWSQRVRQAYDEFARPLRLAAWLSIAPLLVVVWQSGGAAATAAALALAIVPAEIGRRTAGGTRVFPPLASLWAPVWLCERALMAWIAVGTRVAFGGIPYRGRIVRVAANPLRAVVCQFAINNHNGITLAVSAAEERMGQTHKGDSAGPTDVGRTSGGGSLGHRQPPEVTEEAPIRNNPEPARRDADREEDPPESN